MLSELQGLQLTPVDPKKTPPDSSVAVNRLRNYNMWAASPHAKALGLIAGNDKAPAECCGCHSAEGLAAKQQGQKVDPAKKATFNTISCVACHDPHDSEHQGRYRTSRLFREPGSTTRRWSRQSGNGNLSQPGIPRTFLWNRKRTAFVSTVSWRQEKTYTISIECR
jgi:hypothetical protein